MPECAEVARVDAAALATPALGAVWGHAGAQLNVTVLAWAAGHVVDEHVNEEREVVLVGIAGDGRLVVDDVVHEIEAGVVVVIPRGTRREVRAGAGGLTYVSAHQARGLLQVTPRSSPRS